MKTKLAVSEGRCVGKVKLWDIFGPQTPHHFSLSTHLDGELHLQSEPDFK